MSMSNPNNYDNTLPGRLARLEQAVFSSTGAAAGKLKSVAGSASRQSFSWTDGTPITVSAVLAVPAFATTVSLLAVASTVVASNVAAAITAFSELWVTIPELSFAQGAGANVYIKSDNQAQRSRPAALGSMVLPTGTTSLTVTANGIATNTGTNVDNFIGIDVLALFQY